MKRVVIAVGLLLCSLGARAEESCPADRAADAGVAAFGAFHHIMAPAWHQAWPNKDYDALLAVGPKFTEAFAAIDKLDPKMKTPARRRTFETERRRFGEFVARYAEACDNGDTALVYKLMPDLHNAFESTAATLLPISFPEFEGLTVTLDLIIQSHFPENNVKGLVGSTETLLAKMETLIGAELPPDLQESKAEIQPKLEMMRQLVLHMLESLYKNNLKEYAIYATELKTQCDEFAALYI